MNIQSSAQIGDLEWMRQNAHKCSKEELNEALCLAVTNGHTNCVSFLKNDCEVFWAILKAHQYNQLECLKLLLPHLAIDPENKKHQLNPIFVKDSMTSMFHEMMHNNNIEGVKVLLGDPKMRELARDSWLDRAALHGKTQLVTLLLDVCDPKNNQSRALIYASTKMHQECFDVLYPLSDPFLALEKLNKSPIYTDEQKHMLRQRVQSDHEKSLISDQVSCELSQKKKKI